MLTVPVLTVTPEMPTPEPVDTVPEIEYVLGGAPQSLNLKSWIRVFQLPDGRYMPTIQNVQSSLGSTAIW